MGEGYVDISELEYWTSAAIVLKHTKTKGTFFPSEFVDSVCMYVDTYLIKIQLTVLPKPLLY
jgi:hypothetical protein